MRIIHLPTINNYYWDFRTVIRIRNHFRNISYNIHTITQLSKNNILSKKKNLKIVIISNPSN